MKVEHLNAEPISLGGIDIPEDFTFEMKVEDECPCGCREYNPSTLMIVDWLPPMNINECVECKRPQMKVSVWNEQAKLD